MKTLMMCLVVMAGCGSSSAGLLSDDNPDANTSDVDANTGDDADAMGDIGPTCTANTQVDPDNCGACGRSCLGGTCTAGRCDATRLDSGDISGIGDFTTDGLFMYYTGFTTGTGANHRLWKLVIGPAVNTDYLTAFSHPTPLTQIAFDGDFFYTAEPNRIDTVNRGQVKKVNKEPFSESNLETFQPPTTTAVMLAGNNVYYATDTDGANGGDIKRVPATGGNMSTITASAGFVSYMIADATSIYWVDNGAGGLQPALRKAPITGGPTSEITSGVADYIDMDTTRIYMVRKNTGTLISVPKTGGSATPLGHGLTSGGAVDDEYVYAAKINQLVAFTKSGDSMSVLWEGDPQGTSNCPTVMKITRTKVIGSYIYFLVRPTTCNNVELNNAIYRLPRM